MSAIPGFKDPVYDDRAKFFFIRLFMKFGMKNPYEEKKDILSPELFTKKAADVRGIQSRCRYYLEEIRYLVGDLEKLWSNSIQTTLTAELGSIRNSLTDYTELMEEYAALLDDAASELSADPETAKKIAELSEASEEPVPYAFRKVPDLRPTREEEPAGAPFGIPGMRRRVASRDLTEIITGLLRKLGIGRRSKENQTQLLIRELKSMALDMRSFITQYNFHISKMNYTTDDIAKLWENDRHASLIGEFRDIEGPVKDFSNIIDEYATLLEMASQELETNAVESGIGSVLSEKQSGPVSVVLSSIPSLKRSHIDLKAYDPYFERTQTGVSTVVIGTRKNSEYIYNVYEDHIELIKYVGMYRAVEIPRELDGLPVTHIGLDCFALAWRVRFVSITIPDSVTTIYHGAFRNCQYIREFKLPKSLRYIGNYAFAFIQDLEHIDIPDGVVSLGMGAFRNCDNLREIVIPDSVLRIGNDCFYCCRNLGRAVLGSGVVDIDGWAFRMCEHLSEVDLGDSVVNIGEAAFYDDVLLMRLDIPSSVRKIGEHAFYHRRGMTLGVIPGSFAEWHVREFNQKYILL